MSGAIIHKVEIDRVGYRLTFKFGSLRLFEREVGKTVAEALPLTIDITDRMTEREVEAKLTERAGSIPLEVWSAFWWAVLQPQHMMTREASDDLIDHAGPEQVVRWLLTGFAAYNAGDPALLEIAEQTADALGNGAKPPSAKAKRGKTPSS